MKHIFFSRTLPIAIAAIFLLSCGQGNGSNNNGATTAAAAVGYDTTLPTGVVKDTVTCTADAAHSYALYLPKAYNSREKWPCILLFDAHARGALPLRMYQDIAEQYGFILVGSNISKNGTAPDAVNKTIDVLWSDIHQRLHIDSSRTYTSGFSGGSKVAALAAMTHTDVAGVIGCAGGLPGGGPGLQRELDYVGIAGNYDFNLQEMMQLNAYLAQKKYPHLLFTWQGIHTWAPAAEYKSAVLWMMANSMKRNTIVRNDTVITALKNALDHRIATAVLDHDLTTAAMLLEGTISILDGLIDVSNYRTQLTRLTNGSDYKSASAAVQQIMQREQAQMQELAAQFTTQNEQWWIKKIIALNRQASSAPTIQEANATRRVLAFLGFVGYMNVSRALAADDMANAVNYLKIFKMADPQNPDCSYFAALYNARKADAKATIAALSEAANQGYSDIEQLSAEPSFAPLQNDPAFLQIKEKIRSNHSGRSLKK